jgi:HK97 family phage prohead protease
MPSFAEYRATGGELRAAAGRTISGYAAVYGAEYDCGTFVETIRSGAFKPVLQDDVRCLMNHDPCKLLGRTKSGTMSIREDSKGLFFECELPDTQSGQEVHAMVKRGDLSGCSFSFTVDQQEWSDNGQRREIVRLKNLYDAGPVTYPAYPATSVTARARDPLLSTFRSVGFARSTLRGVYIPARDLDLDCERSRLRVALAKEAR